MAKTKAADDDLGGALARGDIDLTELNARASAAGAAVTTAEARNAARGDQTRPASPAE